MKKIRFKEYGKLLLELEGRAEIVCPRCKIKAKIDTKKNS